MNFLQNIDNDINKGVLQNIDIDTILYRLEFGISNRAIQTPVLQLLFSTISMRHRNNFSMHR